MLAAYSEGRGEWLWMAIGKGGSTWWIRKWMKGAWRVDMASIDCTMHQSVDVEEAKTIFIEFVGQSMCIEYNGVDHLRINSWLSPEQVPFFDLLPYCVSRNSKKKRVLFGKGNWQIHTRNANTHTPTRHTCNITSFTCCDTCA